MFKTDGERIAARQTMFQEMDTDKSGTITFEEWLTFAYKHICSKTANLDGSLTGVPPVFVAGRNGCPRGF